MPQFTNTSRHDDVLVVEIDNPPVNALSPGVPEALAAALDDAERDPGVDRRRDSRRRTDVRRRRGHQHARGGGLGQ